MGAYKGQRRGGREHTQRGMRVWKYAEYAPWQGSKASISPRGLHLLLVEFLVRHPTDKCVLTAAPPGLSGLAGLFPGTTFHVYKLFEAEDAAVPNVVPHACAFDKEAAEGWSIRPRSFNMVFVGEGMDRQMAVYMGTPARVALLLITEPPEYYLEGEVIYPLWCTQESHLCGLVVKPRADGSTKAFRYGAQKYLQGMMEFQATQRGDGGAAYDSAMESMILNMYTATQCSDPGAAALLSEIVRMGLPPKGEAEFRF